jgi:hypothetical protein
VRRVGRETVVQGRYAGDVADGGGVGGRREEVCGCGFSAERGLEGVAPGAAVDVAVGRVSGGVSGGEVGECT